jgi:protein-disulfide isomerase
MSGRKARQARRVPAPPKAEPATGRDRRALLLVAAIGAVVVAAGVIALALAVGGGSDSTTSAPVGKLPQATGIATLFRGIPQHGLVLGKADAPVTVVEYVDLQCPWCGKFARETFPSIVDDYVRPGKIKVEMRPLDFVGSDSVRGRNALFAASSQDKAFDFEALLYANQGTENTGWLSDQMVRAVAASIPGLDGASIIGAGSDDGALAARIERQRGRDGITGVPTFLVNGETLVNPTEGQLRAALG